MKLKPLYPLAPEECTPAQAEPLWRQFLYGFFLGPFALMSFFYEKKRLRAGAVVGGWLCGWFVLVVAMAAFLSVRQSVREAEAERAAMAVLEAERKEMARLAQIEREREAAAEKARLAEQIERRRLEVLCEVRKLRDQVDNLGAKVNNVLAGRTYPGFDAQRFRFLDTRREPLNAKVASPIAGDMPQMELESLKSALALELERLEGRLSRFAKERDRILKEEEERKLAARKKCSHCMGMCEVSAYVQCEACKGTKTEDCEVQCRVCSGRGRVSTSTSCVQCKGKGTVRSECSNCQGTGRSRCFDCRGKGENFERSIREGLGGSVMIGRRRSVSCASCHGSGSVECPYCSTVTCQRCEGVGKVPVDHACKTCKGAGVRHQRRPCQKCVGGTVKIRKKCDVCSGRGWTSPLE